MDKKQRVEIKKDFLTWTGGFPPDSETTVFLYIEYASPADSNDNEVRAILLDWLEKSSR